MSVYSVYSLTSPNGKRYVGMTMRNPEIRWNNGRGYKTNEPFFDDIQKFGWENIEKKILASGLNEHDASIFEGFMIAVWHTRDPRFGYNIYPGGKHPKVLDERAKRKMSISSTGKIRSEEYRRHISEAKMGNKNGMYGKSGKLNPMSRKVIAIREGEVLRFDGISEGSRFLNLSKNAFKNISACCMGKRKSAYGYVWRYADDTEN